MLIRKFLVKSFGRIVCAHSSTLDFAGPSVSMLTYKDGDSNMVLAFAPPLFDCVDLSHD